MIRASRNSSKSPLSGIDGLLADDAQLEALRRRRVGLLTNAACRTTDGTQTAIALNVALGGPTGGGLTCLFAPEHGLASDQAAGDAVADHRDAMSGIEVISLYGERQVPTPDHLDGIDSLVIDLRDVGVRCYTYAPTAAMAADAALSAGVDVIVCDRSNPLGPQTDGPLLDPAFKSFLAYFAVPFVHGRNIGTLIADALRDHPRSEQLTVITAPPGDAIPAGVWVPPSPSLTTPESVALYPGLVLFEGTNLSEGRGTPLPFRCIGAPWLDAEAAASAANSWPTGVDAVACQMQPTSGDYAEQTLSAIRFERNAEDCDGLGLGVRLLAWIADAHPEFEWRTVPARPKRYFINTLLGTDSLRNALSRGESADDILASWRD